MGAAPADADECLGFIVLLPDHEALDDSDLSVLAALPPPSSNLALFAMSDPGCDSPSKVCPSHGDQSASLNASRPVPWGGRGAGGAHSYQDWFWMSLLSSKVSPKP